LPTSAKSATFTAYAFSKERIKSATAQKDFVYQAAAVAKPRAWLLQIGVNHYQASGCELQFSANDAVQMSKALGNRLAVRGFDVKAVQLVSTTTQLGATKQEIHKALASIAAVATPDDVFLLSFSGHGYSSPDGQFYILPSNIQGSCSHADAALLKNAISSDELADWLRPIDAGEMTFVLDSCFSAKSVEANDFKPGPMGSRGLGQLAYDKRMRILAASQSDETAGEYASLGSGLLSYVLTHEGLVEKKADWKPVDQKITVGEWLSYAADAVPEFDQKSTTNTDTKGATLEGGPARPARSAQIPAVFDFSKSDSFVLQ
jgi:Caspase domain